MAMPIPTKPASAVWIGTRARPLFVTVLPHDRRPPLRWQCLVRVRVGNDPGAVSIPDGVPDHDARRVRARIPHSRPLRDDVRDRRATRLALADVVRGVGGSRDVVVVDRAAASVLDVDPVAPDVPGCQVRRAETVRALPVEGILEEVPRRHVQDRDAVRVHDDPVPPHVGPVEDDPVPIGACDRDVVRGGRHHVSPGVDAGREDDRVTRPGPRDRELESRDILWDVDGRAGARLAVGGSDAGSRDDEHAEECDHQHYACRAAPHVRTTPDGAIGFRPAGVRTGEPDRPSRCSANMRSRTVEALPAIVILCAVTGIAATAPVAAGGMRADYDHDSSAEHGSVRRLAPVREVHAAAWRSPPRPGQARRLQPHACGREADECDRPESGRPPTTRVSTTSRG